MPTAKTASRRGESCVAAPWVWGSMPSARSKSSEKRTEMVVLLAQEYAVVARVADSARSFFVNLGFALLSTGTFVAVAARDPRQRPPAGMTGPQAVSRDGTAGPL